MKRQHFVLWPLTISAEHQTPELALVLVRHFSLRRGSGIVGLAVYFPG